jgi:ABC-type amino acid transport substrate-binding protein
MRALWLIMLIAALAPGAPLPEDSLLVGIKPAPPFVMIADDQSEPRGFSIDLIRAVGRSMTPPREVRFYLDTSLADHLRSVREGRVDLGIAATTITAEREREMDFSQPFFEDYLGMLAPARPRGVAGFFTGLFRFDIAFGELYSIAAGILAYLLVCSAAIWLAERGRSFDRHWLKGIGQGIWWTIVTMSTVGYGDFVPTRRSGRLIGILVVFSGIVLFGVAIASLSSMLTINQLQASITDIDDIRGKRVAIIRDAASEDIAAQWNTRIVRVESVREGVEALGRKRVLAFVHDVSLIRNYLRTREAGDQGLTITPLRDYVFNYAITFPPGSPLREPATIALLSLQEGEHSTHDRLIHKWFGVADK